MNYKKLFSLCFPVYAFIGSLLIFAPMFGNQTFRQEQTVGLLTEHKHISGLPFKLGVLIQAPENAHIYGKYPGSTGTPLDIVWELPEGFILKSVSWPSPELFQEEGMISSGYNQSVFVTAEIIPPQDLSEGEKFTFRAKVNWLACNSQCFPGTKTVECQLSYLNDESKISEESSRFFKAHSEHILKEIVSHKSKILLHSGELIIKMEGIDYLPIPDAAEAFFIADDRLDYSVKPGFSKENNDLYLRLKLLPKKEPSFEAFEGVLFLKDASGKYSDVISLSVKKNDIEIVASENKSNHMFGLTLLLCAFVGGLLLNVMPCVLPMITVKIYGIIKTSGDSRAQVVKNGLFFSLGVIGCFWLLAGVSCLLRALGHNVGWGFQLQEPLFVGILITVLFVFGLSSLGVFEVGTSLIGIGNGQRSSSSSVWGSLLNGVLATLVTTPCTGPLLGPVLGFATSLPVMGQLSVFTLIGSGMALPYLMLSLFPKLTTFLPKPGAWMEIFKQLTGFVMLGTVVWLFWVFGTETGASATVILMAALLVAAVSVWILGKWGHALISGKKRRLARIAVSCLIIVSGFLTVKASRIPSTSMEYSDESAIRTFSDENLEKFRSTHKGVFVDFTAKWCLTCQLNKPVLHTKRFMDFCREHDIVFMTADWTKKNPQITAELSKLGRSGVPLYVFYPSDKTAPPKILSHSLNSSILQEELIEVLRTSTMN
ncbi:MAG: thioredoxin family protein [Victivallaceae bacterium]